MTFSGVGRAAADDAETDCCPGGFALSASLGGSQAASAATNTARPVRAILLSFIDVHRSYPEFALAIRARVEVHARRARPVDGLALHRVVGLKIRVLVENGER